MLLKEAKEILKQEGLICEAKTAPEAIKAIQKWADSKKIKIKIKLDKYDYFNITFSDDDYLEMRVNPETERIIVIENYNGFKYDYEYMDIPELIKIVDFCHENPEIEYEFED